MREKNTPQSRRVKLLMALRTLFAFKTGSSIDIRIRGTNYVLYGIPRQQKIDPVISIILPTILKLRTAGFKVKITCEHLSDPLEVALFIIDATITTLDAIQKSSTEVSGLLI